MASGLRPVSRPSLVLLALLVSIAAQGCTSALTTAYLKGTPWNLGEHAGDDDGTAATAPESAGDDAPSEPSPEARAAARAAAVEQAVDRLAAIGRVDPETEAALVELLQRTDQEDWPTVVEEFVAALTASPRVVAAPGHGAAPGDGVALPSSPTSSEAAASVQTVTSPPPAAPEPPDLVATESTTSSASRADEPDAAPLDPDTAASTGPAVAVQNACFATRVQAWGVVERFAADRFRPGQELIVYFELDNLSVDRTPAGHTTCIDTGLVLTTADGGRLHAWTFEPIRETCPARRRDYFARYVVQIPGTVPAGPCRLEIAVTDTLAGGTATTVLPLEIVAE